MPAKRKTIVFRIQSPGSKLEPSPWCWKYTNAGDFQQVWENVFLNQQGIRVLYLLKGALGLKCGEFFYGGKS